jgi:hypothetical protein
MKSFKPKDGSGEPPAGGRNGERGWARIRLPGEAAVPYDSGMPISFYKTRASRRNRRIVLEHWIGQDNEGAASRPSFRGRPLP